MTLPLAFLSFFIPFQELFYSKASQALEAELLN